MKPEIHKEKVKKYGSFLYCPQRDCLCFGCDTDDGTCGRQTCCLDDPEYIKLQKRIKENMRINARKEREEREAEKKNPPAPIRRQRKSAADVLREQIARKEALAVRLYRENKPKKADAVMREAMALRAKLRRLK